VRRWPARSEDLAERVCSHVDRPLSQDEWSEIFPDDLAYETICPSAGSNPAGGEQP